MKNECFDKSVFQRHKKCGFVTERPLFWAYAVEHYIYAEDGAFANCFYKTKEGEGYIEFKVMLFYGYTKQIEININFNRGVFIVKGDNFLNWIDDEFPTLLEKYATTMKPEDNKSTETKEPVIEEKEMDAVWHGIAANKTSIRKL